MKDNKVFSILEKIYSRKWYIKKEKRLGKYKKDGSRV